MRALTKGAYKTFSGEYYGTPKELWGFRKKGKGTTRNIARDFLHATTDLLGIDKQLQGLRFRKALVQSLMSIKVLTAAATRQR